MRVLHAVGPEWIDGVRALFQAAWWAQARTHADVASNLVHSTATAGIVDDDGTLVAFARALSDGSHRAVVLDVVVVPDQRRDGLGRAVMDALLADPTLCRVESIALWCKPEHVPFYELFEFTDDVSGMRLMVRGAVDGS